MTFTARTRSISNDAPADRAITTGRPHRPTPGPPGAVACRRGLPDDPDPAQSRYLEAEVAGLVIGGLYLPNGNPAPGPKFDYKIAWFDALAAHARTLFAGEMPVVLAGDWNVIPTDGVGDVYQASRMAADALTQPASREC